MKYHDRIMSLPVPAERQPSIPYKEGHRDARHAAAEIAVEAESEIMSLREELDRAWRQRNEAFNKVRAWEGVVYVTGGHLPMRLAEGREWGPGGDEPVAVPSLTPGRLTDLLDELAQLRSKAS